MAELKKNKEFHLSTKELNTIKEDFLSESLSENETKATIKKIYDSYGILIDPHTAVATGVLSKIKCDGINVILSTAHPSKFPETVKEATGAYPDLPSNQKSIILDCYCGSGTTILAAQQNQRKWIGIDNSQLAIKKTKEKLGDNKDLFNSFIDYKFLNFTKRKKI